MAHNGILHAVKDNNLLWKYQLEQGSVIHWSSPTLDSNGTIYFGSDDKYLYAINPNGSPKWRYYAGGLIRNSPAIALDGTLYVGSSENSTLHALNPDGSLKWNLSVNGGIQGSSPTIADDGTIYVGVRGNPSVYAVNPDGTIKWTADLGDAIDSSPAIGTDGSIYFGSGLGRLYALYPDGTLKWQFQSGNTIWSSPAVDADDNVYFYSSDAYIYSIDKNGVLRWKYNVIAGGAFSSPAIGKDGILYTGGNGIYAFGNPDTLSPTIIINFPQGIVSTQTVPIDVSITDPSGVTNQAYFLDGNEIPNTSTSINLTYSQPGDHIFKVNATDNNGNTGSEISTFTYSPTTSSIHDGIDQMYKDGKITKLGNSLYDKLDQAQTYINSGQYAQAKKKLQALLNEIEAQRGKKIDTEAANILIEQIRYLIESLK